jgi:geranylgeranylglycerol-phosphate geranylgeranyltransferase
LVNPDEYCGFMILFMETLRLIRAVNCLLAMVGVLVGAYMTWLRPLYGGTLLAAVAAFFVCAGGNVVNDLLDIETDSINHPQRVLVRNTLSRRYAIILAVALNALALMMAAIVNWAVAGIALASVILLLLYNFRLKRIPLVGNVTISILAGLTFITGGLAVDHVMAFTLPGPIIPALFAFFFTW